MPFKLGRETLAARRRDFLPKDRFALSASRMAKPEWLGAGSVAGLPPESIKSFHMASFLSGSVGSGRSMEGKWSALPVQRHHFAASICRLVFPCWKARSIGASPVASFLLSRASGSPSPSMIGGKLVENSFVAETAPAPLRSPKDLEEWLQDGAWVPGSPGRVRSPFKTNPEVDVSSGEWASGGLVTCPASKKRFRLPAEPLWPSLELEKGAVDCVREDPEADASAVAHALGPKFAEATAEIDLVDLEAPWLGDAGKAAFQRANRPGAFGRSRHGAQPLQIAGAHADSAADWEPGAAVRCAETGQRFLLPDRLPPLQAQLVTEEPGMVVSPFAPDRPFQINPADWRGRRCAEVPADWASAGLAGEAARLESRGQSG